MLNIASTSTLAGGGRHRNGHYGNYRSTSGVLYGFGHSISLH